MQKQQCMKSVKNKTNHVKRSNTNTRISFEKRMGKYHPSLGFLKRFCNTKCEERKKGWFVFHMTLEYG
jgi:hypothetical protein